MNKPHNLVVAIRLMWSLFAITAFSMLSPLLLVTQFSNSGGAIVRAALIPIGIQLVLLAGLIVCVALRQNWARWCYAILIVLNLVSSLGVRGTELWLIVLKAFLLIANAYVLYLLFRPDVSSWYKNQEPTAERAIPKT